MLSCVKRSPVAALDADFTGVYLPVTSATSTRDEIDKLLPSVQIKKLFNEGKLSSSEETGLCKSSVPSTTWTRLRVSQKVCRAP